MNGRQAARLVNGGTIHLQVCRWLAGFPARRVPRFRLESLKPLTDRRSILRASRQTWDGWHLRQFIVAVEGKGSRDPLDRPFSGWRISASGSAIASSISLRLHPSLCLLAIDQALFRVRLQALLQRIDHRLQPGRGGEGQCLPFRSATQ